MKKLKSVLVVGRLSDDENSAQVYKDKTKAQAVCLFKHWLRKAAFDNDESWEGREIYIDVVASSSSPIKLLEFQG